MAHPAALERGERKGLTRGAVTDRIGWFRDRASLRNSQANGMFLP